MNVVADYFHRSWRAAEDLWRRPEFVDHVNLVAFRIVESVHAGGKVLLAGNGGSAADAQHIAAELVGRYRRDRVPLAAIALSTDTSVLTAIGNDYSFEEVFARQIRALGRPGDVFVAISTSGMSDNVLRAARAARELGLTVVGLTGIEGRNLDALCDVCIRVPSHDTPIVQQLHVTVGHAICAAVEDAVIEEEG